MCTLCLYDNILTSVIKVSKLAPLWSMRQNCRNYLPTAPDLLTSVKFAWELLLYNANIITYNAKYFFYLQRETFVQILSELLMILF